ncbi:MAG: hypothetical protein HC789_11315 [Microcoleus sp. CSU_2_2]|nr:hypothetical protein [Microcoleus sp. SU_5_3]NJS10906.1 hypothetical protein [Microcoleus sp. CSU_2_2]
MPKVTYPTKTPSNLTDFCEAMVAVFGKVERDSDKALSIGKNLNELKQIDQKHYIINARHFYSLYGRRKGEIASCLKCHSNQIYQLEFAIKAIEKRTPTIDKNLNDLPISFGIGTSKSLQNFLSRSIHQKQRLPRKLIKFMGQDGESFDLAVNLVLGRRVDRPSERLQGKIALCLSVDRHDRSCIFWHPLSVKNNWALNCIVMTI